MPEKKSLKQQAYDEIKRKIVTCEYAPNTLLNEELLREELHVSRTPIRDALSRLEQKGHYGFQSVYQRHQHGL